VVILLTDVGGIILMAIGGYFIVVIGGYSINDYWWLFYY
jgi:hypothetical protein